MRNERNAGKLRQWISVQIVKNPRRVILLCIILFNLLFFSLAAVVISQLAPSTLAESGFWPSVFYTVTMILDAGCIQFVVEDVGQAGVAVIVSCLLVVLIGMVTFTGCVIGYVTSMISGFVDHSNADDRRITVSDHTVILNWNNRASEIVNDLLYSEHPERIIVLVSERKQEVMAEIENRLADTVARENQLIRRSCEGMSSLGRWCYCRRHRFRDRLTVIVRQGDPFSAKQLLDISLDKAKTVIILNRNVLDQSCQYANEDLVARREKGNPVTVKTLVLVAEITAAESSADDQKIIVEVEDEWTAGLVAKIIAHKEKLGKCNILPVHVNRVLGQLLSQFSIMPQLNLVYSELFSNRGAEFYSIAVGDEPIRDIQTYMDDHFHAIPLTSMETKGGRHCFFMADLEEDLERTGTMPDRGFTVRGDPDTWQPRRNVLILGHNSKIPALMDGFQSYRNEWDPARDGRDILNIFVVDDPKSLERVDRFAAYPYVNQVIDAELYDREKIYAAINSFIDDQDGDTGILILSDDAVSDEDLDAAALTYLIYVQDILTQRRAEHGGQDTERIDVVVEILNPKNYDVVHSYSVNNVVISNRYISKMITQIGEKEALFEFYSDILTYDAAESDTYVSKELYIKRVGDVFLEVPGPCSAAELIRAVYQDIKRFGEENLAIVLGYLTREDEMILFSGDQSKIHVELHADDKLILFSNH